MYRKLQSFRARVRLPLFPRSTMELVFTFQDCWPTEGSNKNFFTAFISAAKLLRPLQQCPPTNLLFLARVSLPREKRRQIRPSRRVDVQQLRRNKPDVLSLPPIGRTTARNVLDSARKIIARPSGSRKNHLANGLINRFAVSRAVQRRRKTVQVVRTGKKGGQAMACSD